MQIERQSGLTVEKNDSHSIILSMDVNTLPLNIAQRFKYDNLIFFANDAAGFVAEVTKEIESDC